MPALRPPRATAASLAARVRRTWRAGREKQGPACSQSYHLAYLTRAIRVLAAIASGDSDGPSRSPNHPPTSLGTESKDGTTGLISLQSSYLDAQLSTIVDDCHGQNLKCQGPNTKCFDLGLLMRCGLRGCRVWTVRHFFSEMRVG